MNPDDTQAIERIRRNAGLTAAPQSDEVTRIRINAGLEPQPRSPELLRVLANANPKLLTEAERAALLPRDPTVLRVIGNSWPSQLTQAERWGLLPEGTRRVLANHQSASGFKHVPDAAIPKG
jgi:hypothetical protein